MKDPKSEPSERVAILGSLSTAGIVKFVPVPPGQSLDFDPGPGATRRWLHPHLAGQWHLLEFVSMEALERLSYYTAERVACAALTSAPAQPEPDDDLIRKGKPLSPKRDIVGLLRSLERQSEDNIWRTAQEAREEIERLREHAVILAATAEQVERERCAKLLRDMWYEQEAAHGNRAGPYHDGWTAALDLAERRLLGLAAEGQAIDAQPEPPTIAQIDSACMSYRHDFGLMDAAAQDRQRFVAKEWLHAWRKEFAVGPQPEPPHPLQMKADQIGRDIQAISDKFGLDKPEPLPAGVEPGKWERIEKLLSDYVDDYELEDDSGCGYSPTEGERVLILDAIMGLTADNEFLALLATPPTLTDAQCDAIRAEERERIADLWAGCTTEAEGHGLVDIGASIRAGQLVDEPE